MANREQHIAWARSATDDQLQRMLRSLKKTDFFGQNADDIAIVKAEIKRRKQDQQ